MITARRRFGSDLFTRHQCGRLRFAKAYIGVRLYCENVRFTNCIFTNFIVPLGMGYVISNPTDQHTEFPESLTNVLVDGCTIHNFKASASFMSMNRSVISIDSFINGAMDYTYFSSF